ncbi:MAG TPA: hypothetical protein VNR65_04535 [Geobacterales bacterium]|jgi:ATP-dependent phosphoenolpyruvate carboxykinase|nr:hypothetical protein [Geobacterales bacterium]
MSLPDTRALVNLALAGKLDSVSIERDPIFERAVPTAAEGATKTPRVSMFEENFKKFQAYVEPGVNMTAQALRAAE